MRAFRILAAALALGLATPALAQDRGTFDLGLYGRYMLLDDDLNLENSIGFGGRLGLFLARNLAVEFEHSITNADASVGSGETKIQPFYLRLAYHIPLGSSWKGILGAGWVRDRMELPSGYEWNDDGYSLSASLQRNFSDRVGLRVDAIGDVLLSPLYETAGSESKTGNISIQAGLNFRFGKSGPKDADKDGVTDDLDACPATPLGEMVDARGCVPPKDADRDGVIDANDRCANTPVGTAVDAAGCPRDSDRDGVIDANDRCGNTPAGTRVDATGCPVPVDSDRDGVMDNVDACANTPAGTRVDARGCPIPVDSDGDGVMDNADTCPNTAAGTRVDSRGCAIVFEAGRTSIVLEGVTFATNRSELTPEAMVVLDRVAAALVNATDVNVEVQGHTDVSGSRALNMRLSGARAESVRAYLVSKGVAASRMTARGYGPDQPTAPNTTALGRSQNRRVELRRTN
jgi:outer membrane protein OmpA-like peptidoglycan-associated protein